MKRSLVFTLLMIQLSSSVLLAAGVIPAPASSIAMSSAVLSLSTVTLPVVPLFPVVVGLRRDVQWIGSICLWLRSVDRDPYRCDRSIPINRATTSKERVVTSAAHSIVSALGRRSVCLKNSRILEVLFPDRKMLQESICP